MAGRTMNRALAAYSFCLWICLQGLSRAHGDNNDTMKNTDKNDTMTNSDMSFKDRVLALEPELIALMGMGCMVFLLTITIVVIICVLSPNRSTGEKEDIWVESDEEKPAPPNSENTDIVDNIADGQGFMDY